VAVLAASSILSQQMLLGYNMIPALKKNMIVFGFIYFMNEIARRKTNID